VLPAAASATAAIATIAASRNHPAALSRIRILFNCLHSRGDTKRTSNRGWVGYSPHSGLCARRPTICGAGHAPQQNRTARFSAMSQSIDLDRLRQKIRRDVAYSLEATMGCCKSTISQDLRVERQCGSPAYPLLGPRAVRPAGFTARKTISISIATLLWVFMA
jgi:hypothetical protein